MCRALEPAHPCLGACTLWNCFPTRSGKIGLDAPWGQKGFASEPSLRRAARKPSLWAGCPEREMPQNRGRPERQGDPPAPMWHWGPVAWGLMADSRVAVESGWRGITVNCSLLAPLAYFIFPMMIFQAGRGPKAELEIAEHCSSRAGFADVRRRN